MQTNQNRAGVAIFISDKIELKTKITTNKVGNYILIIVSINEDLTITYTYAPNNRAPKYMQQN